MLLGLLLSLTSTAGLALVCVATSMNPVLRGILVVIFFLLLWLGVSIGACNHQRIGESDKQEEPAEAQQHPTAQ